VPLCAIDPICMLVLFCAKRNCIEKKQTTKTRYFILKLNLFF
jgi:hypothetical protein